MSHFQLRTHTLASSTDLKEPPAPFCRVCYKFVFSSATTVILETIIREDSDSISQEEARQDNVLGYFLMKEVTWTTLLQIGHMSVCTEYPTFYILTCHHFKCYSNTKRDSSFWRILQYAPKNPEFDSIRCSVRWSYPSQRRLPNFWSFAPYQSKYTDWAIPPPLLLGTQHIQNNLNKKLQIFLYNARYW
jgi:hypothetical protein